MRTYSILWLVCSRLCLGCSLTARYGVNRLLVSYPPRLAQLFPEHVKHFTLYGRLLNNEYIVNLNVSLSHDNSVRLQCLCSLVWAVCSDCVCWRSCKATCLSSTCATLVHLHCRSVCAMFCVDVCMLSHGSGLCVRRRSAYRGSLAIRSLSCFRYRSVWVAT